MFKGQGIIVAHIDIWIIFDLLYSMYSHIPYIFIILFAYFIVKNAHNVCCSLINTYKDQSLNRTFDLAFWRLKGDHRSGMPTQTLLC